MSPGLGEAFPEIEELRRTAAAGGGWYQGSGTSVTVMVNTDKTGGVAFTAYDLDFSVGGEESATFSMDISGREGISPGSSSPNHGWVGWLLGDVVLAWQWPEGEMQGVARWDGRSPFTGHVDELEDDERTEGFARLAAAIVCHMWDLEERGLAYLPKSDGPDEA